VHELGHLLTGLALGFRFQLFVVLFFGFQKPERGIEFFLNKNPGYMGGVAATVPTGISADNRKKFAPVVAAGGSFLTVCHAVFRSTGNNQELAL
jgi:hypothetical protein